jgi:hypothetical protein
MTSTTGRTACPIGCATTRRPSTQSAPRDGTPSSSEPIERLALLPETLPPHTRTVSRPSDWYRKAVCYSNVCQAPGFRPAQAARRERDRDSRWQRAHTRAESDTAASTHYGQYGNRYNEAREFRTRTGSVAPSPTRAVNHAVDGRPPPVHACRGSRRPSSCFRAKGPSRPSGSRRSRLGEDDREFCSGRLPAAVTRGGSRCSSSACACACACLCDPRARPPGLGRPGSRSARLRPLSLPALPNAEAAHGWYRASAMSVLPLLLSSE